MSLSEFNDNLKNNIHMKDVSVILDPVSQMLLDKPLESIFSIIKNVRDVGRVIVWATVGKLNQDFVIPFLEHMSDLIVTFKFSNNLTILKKKRGDAELKVII